MKMNEYISKEAMLKNLTSDLEHHSDEGDPRTHLVMQLFVKYVEDFPAADVQPVKHGRWIYSDIPIFGNPYGRYLCSLCDFAMDERDYNFCPNCGADMRGETE